MMGSQDGEDQLVYRFHAAGMWTPDEIAETMRQSAVIRTFPNLPPRQEGAYVRALMDHRFQLERRGMWGIA